MIPMHILNSEHSEGNKLQYHRCARVLWCVLSMGPSNSNIIQGITGSYVKKEIIVSQKLITAIYDNCLLGFME
jgi:hypothetical protein